MTAATPGPGPELFSILSGENDRIYRTRRETFIFSLLGQAAILGLLIYFMSCVIEHPPVGSIGFPKSLTFRLSFRDTVVEEAAIMIRFRLRRAICHGPRSILNLLRRR